MRVWTCNDHDGHWPVGTASVVVAPDEGTARSLLAAELATRGLDADRFTLVELETDGLAVRVLRDGDY